MVLSESEPLLSVTDVARYLNVSTTTVRNLAVGGKVRSTRVGDRIRFRRAWLDEWIDAGGGEVPPPPTPKPPAPERAVSRPTTQTIRRRAEPKPRPPTYIQRVADQELLLLSDRGGGRGASTWHVGVRSPLCEASGRWTAALKRWPRGFMCKSCLSALAALPDADLSRFDIGQVYMMRLSLRGASATVIRAGYHAGDGRKTLCGKKDGPWALTEREPRTKQCFVCDHRRRWNARDDEPNILTPRPVTPMKVLVDAGPLDPRLVEMLEAHPQSLDARQATEPLDDNLIWSNRWQDAHQRAERIGRFTGPQGPFKPRPDRWLEWTISDRLGYGLTVADALERMPGWAIDVERAMALYAKWAKESPGRKRLILNSARSGRRA